ncbi:hypothetical protein [Hyalangium rubrum]|uniref:Uncharacterized protein n=1 Tax=Hyalangium rubrum TaxID=3103134 RepID=A0ABU5GXG9_9BACT|nr:hypothetical protein [Hyalangium sp. s54d21]MDY7225577.1 hypothetical protein [Hyalangium sp. s54d21]
MDHMPYEHTGLEAHQDEHHPKREEPMREMPSRTPHSAEGPDKERKVPGGEPGKTPGSAEGEDFSIVSEPPRH